ncbi:Gibberellin cluster GA4 desaturase [Lachnellula hyalina]|uniref:Gibberellin cluster GA4 desaturase n=1 Tax=Lachnellula hyalina TaxID=1316788 RepID=A0A8H8QUV1_9HELO|nr:Gibberellin cluster GA4 desaturase [Lachnellula hyalina]TVY22580.1 Gibberellin cluster GA4 desaturase [Lachnellula hyalina]
MAAAVTQRPLDVLSAPHLHPNPALEVNNPSKSLYTPRHVTATFNYFKPNEDGSPPAPAYVGRPETYERPSDPHTVTVHDIRGSEDEYSLDKTGFGIFKHESTEKDFTDEEKIKDVYYKEVEGILKKATGATRILIFDHTIRRAVPGGDSSTQRGPVQRVHIDQSYTASSNRVSHHLPLEAAVLLQSRHQIINVWRPIKTIRKDPLGVADARSVGDEDLVPIGLIYPDRAGETCSVAFGAEHRWHYLNEQSPEEVLLIKCFDSETDGRARRVPHSAFVDEERVGEETRESIEVRALVFG